MPRLLSDIERICGLGLDARALRSRVMARVRQDIAHDAFCFGTVDPRTLLVTDDVSLGIPPGSGQLASHNEYVEPDVDKFADLARSGRTVGILGHSTGGDPSASARFRTVLPAIGVAWLYYTGFFFAQTRSAITGPRKEPERLPQFVVRH